MLSLVVPCYNEEGNVELFFSEVNRVFEGKVEDYEFVFVNDGSRDKTYQKLKGIHANLIAVVINILVIILPQLKLAKNKGVVFTVTVRVVA